MQTLVIAPFSPYPLVFGGAIRLYHLLKMFAQVSDVTLLAYRSWSEDGDNIGDLRTFCDDVILIDANPVHTQKKSLLQLRSLLSPRTFQYYAHYSPQFQRALDMLVARKRFDCIVTDFSQMAYFSYAATPALKILDLHNIEHELLQRRADTETQWIKKAALAIEAKKFGRDELRLCQQFDLVFAPSEREQRQLQALIAPTRVESLPNSINTEYFAYNPSFPTANEITFIGTTHVDANRDGLCYFMAEIFPLIERAVPDVHFTIVGGDPPADIRAFGQRPNVDVTGYVKDVRTYMARAKALVVPLRTGGGTRLKVLEGLSFGVPTVSTSLGSEGISVTDGQDILLADTPEQFAQQVVTLLSNQQLQRRLSAHGRVLVEQEYSWQAVGQRLQMYLEPMLHQQSLVKH